MNLQARDPGSPPITERDVRERFDAKLWDFWQVVAWILYRTPEHLDEFVDRRDVLDGTTAEPMRYCAGRSSGVR